MRAIEQDQLLPPDQDLTQKIRLRYGQQGYGEDVFG